jgi:hypothetical protein
MNPKCKRCDGIHWVCEAHDDLPWDGASPHAHASADEKELAREWEDRASLLRGPKFGGTV